MAECLRGQSSASVITWGAELSQPRAEEAAKALDLALATAWENTILAPGSIGLLLLNPPYDWDGVEGKRLELHFLRSTAKKLRPDGVLVYIIPQSRIDAKIAKALSGYYDDLRCFRFPDGEYEAFKQVVIFGHRRASFLRDDDLAAKSLAWATAELPEMPEGDGEYKIPVGPEKSKAGNPIRFRRSDLMPEDLLRETRRDGALLTRAWKDLRPRYGPGHPPGAADEAGTRLDASFGQPTGHHPAGRRKRPAVPRQGPGGQRREKGQRGRPGREGRE